MDHRRRKLFVAARQNKEMPRSAWLKIEPESHQIDAAGAAVVEIFQATPEHLKGRALTDLIHEDHHGALIAAIQKAVEGYPAGVEVDALTSFDLRRPVHVTLRRVEHGLVLLELRRRHEGEEIDPLDSLSKIARVFSAERLVAIEEVLALVASCTGYPYVELWRDQGDAIVLRAVWHTDDRGLLTFATLSKHISVDSNSDDLVVQAWKGGRIIFYNAPSEDLPFLRQRIAEQAHLKSCVMAPVLMEGHVRGVIGLFDFRHQKPTSERETMIRALADMVGLWGAKRENEMSRERNQMVIETLLGAVPSVVSTRTHHPDGSVEYEFLRDTLIGDIEERLDGRVKEEPIIFEVAHAEDQEYLRREMARAARREEVLSTSFRYQKPGEDEIRWAQLVSKPRKNRDGSITWYTVAIDETEIQASRSNALWLEFYDADTRLPGLRLLKDQFSVLLDETRRKNEHMLFLHFDVDGTRKMNTEYGVTSTTETIAEFGRALRNLTNDSEIVGRPFGDEFVVILQGAESEELASRARKIFEIATQQARTASGKDFSVTAAGIQGPVTDYDFDAYMEVAMRVVYATKRYFRGRLTVTDATGAGVPRPPM